MYLFKRISFCLAFSIYLLPLQAQEFGLYSSLSQAADGPEHPAACANTQIWINVNVGDSKCSAAETDGGETADKEALNACKKYCFQATGGLCVPVNKDPKAQDCRRHIRVDNINRTNPDHYVGDSPEFTSDPPKHSFGYGCVCVNQTRQTSIILPGGGSAGPENYIDYDSSYYYSY